MEVAVGERRAACSCGQLSLICEGDPVRVSICYCRCCQQRTGSAFGVQARFKREQIRSYEGFAARFRRPADSGQTVEFSFCPNCGATVHWELSADPDLVVVAVGAFADPAFPAPQLAGFEAKRAAWCPSFESLVQR
jgi:hypothetical protein